MSDEAAFLAQLADHPADDVTRLVYADWLEERGDERGAYLRAEQELAALSEDDPRFADLERGVSERARALPVEWLAAAGKRWDVWLISYLPTSKIGAIKVLRELTCCGLAEGKTVVESIPAPFIVRASRLQAELARDKMHGATSTWTQPEQSLGIVVAIRPWTAASDERFHQSPSFYQVVLSGHRLRRKTAAIHAVMATFFVPESTARHWIEIGAPLQLGRYPTQEMANEIVERLGDAVRAEVQRFDPPPIPLPVSFGVVRSGISTGPFAVRLTEYRFDKKIAVIKAIREVTACGLAEAKAHAERPFPITLREGCDRESAEHLARRFAEFGQVEIVGMTREA